MEGLIRDTVFGYSLRLVSGNRLLKYPDEVNHSLWRHGIEEDAIVDSEKSSNGEEVKSIHLVTWYGPEDPEVCPPSTMIPNGLGKLTNFSESTKLVKKFEAVGYGPDLYS